MSIEKSAISLGADHAGYELKNKLKSWLEEQGYRTLDFGTNGPESVDYPDFAYNAAKNVASGETQIGLLVCGTGIGVSITANKVPGIRAANCCSPEMAKLAREHNDANVLALGARLIDFVKAKEITKAFLESNFEGGRHQKRVDKIHTLTGC